MNLKKLFLTATALFCFSSLFAQIYIYGGGGDWSSPETESYLKTYIKQSFEITGRVYGVDEYEPEPYPLQSANVKVTCMGDTTSFGGMAADPDGDFWVYMSRRDRIKDTRLRISISYLGMQSLDTIIDPPARKVEGVQTYEVRLDSVVLHSNPLTTEEVEIVAELQRMYQRGDTIIFNADAYEMPTGSVLLDLVRRLPGLKYEDGKMTYLGRDIEEIRLNGDSFFKRDMSIALNNMPSDKLKSLKVYEVPDDTLNVMSDNHLIMDMETKEPMSRTLFTNIRLSTTENFDRYSVSADGSWWKQNGGEVSASFNRNTIPYEYSQQLKTEDNNANVYFSKEFDSKWVSASLGYGSNYNESKSANYNKMFMPQFTQNSVSENTNSYGGHNWNGSAGMSGRISEKTWGNFSLNMSQNWNNNSSQSVDSISNEGEGLISSTTQSSYGENVSRDYSIYSYLSRTLGEDDKYYLYVNLSINHSGGEGWSENKSESRFAQLGDSIRKVNHRITTPSENGSYSLNANIQRDMGLNSHLSLGYRFSYNSSKSTQKYEDMADGSALAEVDSLYYDKRNNQIDNNISLDYLYSDSIFRLSASLNATPTIMSVDNINKMPNRDDEHLRYSGIRYYGNANLRVKVFKKSQVGVGYNLSNSLPGVTQLSTVTDYSDPMNISKGNSSLKNSFSHSISLEFQLQSWMRTQVSYGTTVNEITTLTRLDRQTGARITSPANINGSWNMSEYLFLTYPFQDLSLNFTANHSFRHNVAYVQSFTDAAANMSATDYHQVSLRLSGAYSNKCWVIRSDAGYSMDRSKSDYLTTSNGGKRISASADITYQSEFGLGASTRCSYNRPFGYEMASANRPECLWSMSVDYRFLKQRQAMVSVTWRDILKSYKGFNASVSGTSWNESRTFGDTSMFVISFSWRFNSFK